MNTGIKTAILLALTGIISAVLFFTLPVTESAKRYSVSISPDEMSDRCVDVSKRQFSPGYGLGLSKRRPGWTMLIRMDSASWYPPNVLGKDSADWNKFGGVNTFNIWKPSTWPNNRYSSMAVGRVASEPYTFHVAGYTNLLDGSFKATEYLTARAGDLVKVDYDYFNGVAVFEIWVNDDDYLSDIIPVDVERCQINIPGWHGGTLPAPKNLCFSAVLKVK